MQLDIILILFSDDYNYNMYILLYFEKIIEFKDWNEDQILLRAIPVLSFINQIFHSAVEEGVGDGLRIRCQNLKQFNHVIANTVSTQQTLFTEYYGGDTEVTVDEVIRGSAANSIVKQGNMFNSDPDTGYEYLLYNVRVKNIGDDSLSLAPMNELPVYANGVKSDIAFAVLS